MKHLLTYLITSVLLITSGCYAQTHPATAKKLFLVKEGKPGSVIVAPAQPALNIKNAIAELQYHLQRASGVTLPVVDEKTATALPADTVRILFRAGNLPVETYSVSSVGNSLVFTGDGGKSNALQWAVDYYLDTQLGVRWLWPGDVGTYVPQHATIPLPQIDYQGRPPVERRGLRNPLASGRSFEGSPTFLTEKEYQQLLQESVQWLDRFQMGSRSTYRFGHSFTRWWINTARIIPNILLCHRQEAIINNRGRILKPSN